MRAYRMAAFLAAAAVFIIGLCAEDALAKRPVIMKGCKACHKAAPGVVRGKKVASSEAFKSIQVNVGPLVWIIPFDKKTELVGAKSIDSIAKGHEIAVTFTGTENAPLATRISVKQPYKVPAEKVINVDEVTALVAKGKGYLLVDARPAKMHFQGHIPTSVNMYYPKLKDMAAKVLPADKDMLVIFYCAGVT
jgi:hypothetical protein